MNTNARIVRRQARATARLDARNLRTAARNAGITVAQLRTIERQHNIPTGRLFLTLAGIRVMVSDMVILYRALGLDLSTLFAGTSAAGARA